ncbi:MAG: hypothetical protein JWM10_2903 [Myxococcaceae bacterium]|nr:hypothetical protein [Myxococcaceae bacterium]
MRIAPRSLFPGLAALLAAPLVAAQTPPVAAPVAAPSTPLRVVISSGLQGDVARLACLPAADRAAGLSSLARSLNRRTGDDVLRLDAGDLFGASAVAHLATHDHLPELVDAVLASGLRALAIGHRDLAGPRADVIARARALSARGVRTVLSNLSCEPAGQDLCDALVDGGDDPLVLATPAGGVGVVALVAPASLTAIAHDRAEGITLSPPEEALGRAVLAARVAGARFVVAFYDPESPGTLADTVRMVRALPRDQRPDVVFAQDLDRDMATMEIERGAALRVFATEPGRVVETSLPAPTTPAVVEPAGEVPPAVAALGDAIGEQLCRIATEVLPGAALTRPLDREGFTSLLLDVVRESARAEVAVINRGAVRPIANFPLQRRVSRVDVLGAMPFDDVLRVGRIKGEHLAAFMRASRVARFRLRGVTADGDGFLVNGRPLENDQFYRVVTTGFVAEGGDGGFGEEDEVAYEEDAVGTPRETLLAWLATPREGDITTAPVDPARRTRWTFRGFIDASLSNTTITNNPQFQDPQLVRSQGTAIQVDAEGHVDAEQPRYTFENTLRLRLGYQQSSNSDDSDDTGLLKIADLIALRDHFAWRGLWRHRRWYTPLPYVESYLESEFSPPDESPDPLMQRREWHHLQWRPTAGFRLELPLRANLNVGAGMDWESLQPGARPRPVVVVRGELPATTLFHIQDRDVEGQLFTEVAFREPGAQSAETIVRLTARLAVPIFAPLAVSVSYDLFARQAGDSSLSPWALSHDVNLGLRLDLLKTLQLFAY